MNYLQHAGLPIDQLFLDMRRGITANIAAKVRSAAPYLDDRDREIVLAVLDRGQSAAAVGRLTNRQAREVRRHVKRVYRRISAPEFQFVLEQIDRLGGTRRKVASACFLHGLSLRQAAAKLGVTVHMVRRHVMAIRNQHELTRQTTSTQRAA